MSKISIVTAFYDIGRGDWTSDKGFPHYLERSTDTYIQRFSYLAQLDNEIIVFSTSDIIEKLMKNPVIRESNTSFVHFEPRTVFANTRQKIKQIQELEEFQNLIYSSQKKNPEYWNQDYVLVTNLKAYFVQKAIEDGLVSNEMVSWIDFGYCRSVDKIPASKTWEYDFDESKIHMFSYHDYDYDRPISDVVASNDVHILGAKVVARQDLWGKLDQLMFEAQASLFNENLVDDDQTLFLLSYLFEPELFHLHSIPDHQKGYDPFVLFNQYNSTT